MKMNEMVTELLLRHGVTMIDSKEIESIFSISNLWLSCCALSFYLEGIGYRMSYLYLYKELENV